MGGEWQEHRERGEREEEAANQRMLRGRERKEGPDSSFLFWGAFNEDKRVIMETLDLVEQFLDKPDEVEDRSETRRALMERLKAANDLAAGLQEKVARASLFLPSYDLRLGNETVCRLHERITTSRHSLSPPASFSFKSRRSLPASLSTLLRAIHGDTGSTSRQDHFQGNTRATDMDADLCFIDREDQVLIKQAGDVRGRDFVLSRLRRCTIYICEAVGVSRPDESQ
eukprot:765349-Hanusia_phi.AAC.2